MFTRVSDTRDFSPSMAPAGQALLCVEFPCAIGDAVWQKSTEELAKHVVEVMVARHVLDASSVTGWFGEDIANSYPLFELGYGEHLKCCFDFLATFTNVLSFGRQGGFSYINTDTVMHLGFQAAAAVLSAKPAGFTCHEWFAQHSRQSA